VPGRGEFRFRTRPWLCGIHPASPGRGGARFRLLTNTLRGLCGPHFRSASFPRLTGGEQLSRSRAEAPRRFFVSRSVAASSSSEFDRSIHSATLAKGCFILCRSEVALPTSVISLCSERLETSPNTLCRHMRIISRPSIHVIF